jgi:thioredoxin-like negative regulator of GroEL
VDEIKTPKEFDKHINNYAVAFVLFVRQTGCAQCHVVEKIIDDMGITESPILKVDVLVIPEIMEHLGVFCVPTLLSFKDGRPYNQIVGSINKKTLTEFRDEQCHE